MSQRVQKLERYWESGAGLPMSLFSYNNQFLLPSLAQTLWSHSHLTPQHCVSGRTGAISRNYKSTLYSHPDGPTQKDLITIPEYSQNDRRLYA